MTHTVPCSADFDITDPQFGCQQLAGVLKYSKASVANIQHLAGVLKYWKASVANIQHLSCLTQLTHLSCTANSEFDSLEELQQLPLLHTLSLSRLSAVPRDIQDFKFVQSLRLHGFHQEVCNIESHTQLTHLAISMYHQDIVKEILLPTSNGVKLLSLDVWGPPGHEHIFHLKNLTFAARLVQMSSYDASPNNIEQADLSALSSVTCLQCMSRNCAPKSLIV